MPKLPKIAAVFEAGRASRGHAPWRVTTPSSYSETGRKTNKYFATEREAKRYAASLVDKVRTLGNAGLTASQEQILMLHTLTERLAGTDIPPVRAMSIYADLLETYGSPQEIARLAALGQEADTARLQSIHVAEAIQAMQEAKDERQSYYTASIRRGRFARLLRRNPALATRYIHELTTQDVEAALDATHGHQDTSWNNMARELSALFNFAIRKGWCKDNPLRMLPQRTVREAEITALSPRQLLTLFHACRPPRPEDRRSTGEYDTRLAGQDTTPLLLYVAVLAFAGIRPIECTRLTWGDVSLHEGVISVRSRHSKTGGARHVTIRPVLRAWLLACKPADAADDAPLIPPRALKYKISELHRRAGYDDERNPWQDDALRHSFASYLLKNGEDLTRMVMDMGHSSTHLLRTRYLNPRGITPTSAREWWRLTPYRVFSSNQKAPE